MKRDDVTKIFEGATDEQINSILNINSADIGKAKGDYDALKTELSTSKEALEKLTGELNALKDSNASSEDWKAKYEKILDEQNAAKLEREKAEKEAADRADFDSVAVDKDGKPLEFIHDAVRESYFRKYVEAKAAKENQAKTGADIFKDLIKDDACIKVPTAHGTLAGGSGTHEGNSLDDAAINAIMGLN